MEQSITLKGKPMKLIKAPKELLTVETMEEADLTVRLGNGQPIQGNLCSCLQCKTEWVMPVKTANRIPAFCPGCGIKLSVVKFNK